MTAPFLVLCLGNEVLSDDRVGAVLADELQDRWAAVVEVEILFAALAGFSLLELLRDRERVLIVDSICTESGTPGDVYFFELGLLTPSKHLTASHQINLPTVIELGKQLGSNVCDRIDVLAIEAADVTTLSESLTPAVAEAIPWSRGQIEDWIRTQLRNSVNVRIRRPAYPAG